MRDTFVNTISHDRGSLNPAQIIELDSEIAAWTGYLSNSGSRSLCLSVMKANGEIDWLGVLNLA